MFLARLSMAGLIFAGMAFASEPVAVKQTAEKAAQKISEAPAAMRPEFQSMAGETLRPEFPALAEKLFGPAPKPAPAAATPAGTPRPTPPPEIVEIQNGMRQMRGLPTDEDRAMLVLKIVAEIRALPPSIPKLGPISGLSHLVTEGDLGKEALNAVASTLALALNESPGRAGDYVDLARLVRYEHVTPPPPEPALEAAASILKLHDDVVQASGFTLTALNGKTYTLASLKGKVVLLNFWATWCPPCRREMPDMEKLYQQYASQGLVVLAVSDEKRETVEGFLKKQDYTFPVALDPDRKVNTAFGIEGIPNSFLFDREGKLVGQSIDMRTERQFREMFKAAGLR
ncbi:MAG TPA: TlpA disulfide reductase family protein [Bryobacteraceae bacterium]|jgi:peroxiredoxin|nr:TlpA disulfide reductase family protein [Bryobacteraceae bacterium]